MKTVTIWILAAAFTLGLKLFTYEYHLADDPTCGLAARFRPSLVNYQVLQASDVVLLTDENDFPGSRVYGALVDWGFLVVLAAGPAILYLRKRGSKKRGNPVAAV